MHDEIRNRIEIACTPERIYAYVTQPWLWHEWHPNSRSAEAAVKSLAAGDGFREIIELQPLSPLPFRLRRQTQYRVLIAQPHQHWRVRGEMAGGWLQINYEFEPSAVGVLFTRTLNYEVRGIHGLMMPLLKPRMRRMSLVALGNLKSRLEGEA